MSLVAAIAWAALAGVAHAWSIAWPFDAVLPIGQPLAWLQVLSLSALFVLVSQPDSERRSTVQVFWRGATIGWAFACAWLCATVWWLFISMHFYGGLAAPLAALAVWALCGLLALYVGLAMGLWRVFFVPNQSLVTGSIEFVAIKIISFASMILLAELARGVLFTGFPWGAGGYAHVGDVLASLASWVGVYGMGWVAALIAGALGACVMMPKHAWPLGLGAMGCVMAIAAIPAPSVPGLSAQPISLALLQGNIAQHEKFVRKGVEQALGFYANGISRQTAQLVIAPETALPMLPRQLPPELIAQVQAPFVASSSPRAALLGVPLTRGTYGYTNSVIGLQSGQAIAAGDIGSFRYDKHHLVPFGEFIPPLFKWFVRMMNIPLGDFDRGDLAQAPFAFAGERFAPNICYEDLFVEGIAASFTDPDTAPTVMVNFSNIGWFGLGVAIDQHLNISRMRAIEFARPMVRATNTGATAIIDHRGVVTHLLARGQAGVLLGEVRGVSGDITPFAWWASRFGLWPLLIFALASLGAVALWRRRLH